MGEGSQRSGSQGYDRNHGLREDGGIFNDQDAAESLFLTLLDDKNKLIVQIFFQSQKKCDFQNAVSVKGLNGFWPH